MTKEQKFNAKKTQMGEVQKVLLKRRDARLAQIQKANKLLQLRSKDDVKWEKWLSEQGLSKTKNEQEKYTKSLRAILKQMDADKGKAPLREGADFIGGQIEAFEGHMADDKMMIPEALWQHIGGHHQLRCNCGESELYFRPPWSGAVWGPNLTWWPDWQGAATHNWNAAPPYFNWVTRPTNGQVTTASAHSGMGVESSGHDEWSAGWWDVAAEALWEPKSSGKFQAHWKFGDSPGPTNAGTAGRNPFLGKSHKGYFKATLYMRVAYDNFDGNWTNLYENWFVVADHEEDHESNSIGQNPWYWKLHRWIWSPELNIPKDRRVSTVAGATFECQTYGEDAHSGVFFDANRPFLLYPVITGTTCGVI